MLNKAGSATPSTPPPAASVAISSASAVVEAFQTPNINYNILQRRPSRRIASQRVVVTPPTTTNNKSNHRKKSPSFGSLELLAAMKKNNNKKNNDDNDNDNHDEGESRYFRKNRKIPKSSEESDSRTSTTAAAVTTPKKKKQKTKKETPTNKSKSNTNKKEKTQQEEKEEEAVVVVERTKSFGALYAERILPIGSKVVQPPHTLILGTHPSIASLSQQQYYGHPMNAFWYIVGDCLGFRRNDAVSASTGKPYKFASSLRYGNDRILSYEKQIECFVSHGFAVWDIVQECERQGSLDQNIREEIPNDVPAFCRMYPTIRRIVIANGGTGSKFFVRHFKKWIQQQQQQQQYGESHGDKIKFQIADNDMSRQAFGKVIKNDYNDDVDNDIDEDQDNNQCIITLISAISVSPAAARYSYEQKRDYWEKYVYKPGLQDYHNEQKSIQ